MIMTTTTPTTIIPISSQLTPEDALVFTPVGALGAGEIILFVEALGTDEMILLIEVLGLGMAAAIFVAVGDPTGVSSAAPTAKEVLD